MNLYSEAKSYSSNWGITYNETEQVKDSISKNFFLDGRKKKLQILISIITEVQNTTGIQK